MKKLTVLLSLVFLLAFAGCDTTSPITAIQRNGTTEQESYLSGFSTLNESDLQFIFELAKNAVQSYYRSVMLSDTCVSMNQNRPELRVGEVMPITEAVSRYLEAKLAYETYLMSALGHTTSYIRGSYSVARWKPVGNSLWLEIVASIEFQYSDADVCSGLTDTVQLIIGNPADPIISDWYTSAAGNFDSQVRGGQLDLTNESNWLSNQDSAVIMQNISNALDIMAQAVNVFDYMENLTFFAGVLNAPNFWR